MLLRPRTGRAGVRAAAEHRARRRVAASCLAIACIVLLAWGAFSEAGTTYWSPYQKLNIEPLVMNGETVAYDQEPGFVDMADIFAKGITG